MWGNISKYWQKWKLFSFFFLSRFDCQMDWAIDNWLMIRFLFIISKIIIIFFKKIWFITWKLWWSLCSKIWCFGLRRNTLRAWHLGDSHKDQGKPVKELSHLIIRLGSKLFSYSICLNKAQSTRKIHSDFLALRHQCCSCTELIAVIVRESSSTVILYNNRIDDGVPLSNSSWFSE